LSFGRWFFILLIIAVRVIFGHRAVAQNADYPASVPCEQRPHVLDQPWIPAGLACLEEAVNEPSMGSWGFTSLAVSDDGTLYALNAMRGEVYTFDDTDGDALPDAPRMLVDTLRQPTGLAHHDGVLYILDGATLYRWFDDDLEVVRDDLPFHVGLMNGGLIVTDEGFIVGIGASANPDDPDNGTLIEFLTPNDSFSTRADNLGQPFDIALIEDVVWGIDPEHDRLFSETGTQIGFTVDSYPTGTAYYDSNVFPALENKLLVVLSGSNDRIHLTGYSVVTVDVNTGEIAALMPARPIPGSPESEFSNEEMNLRGSGFFPYHPWDVAVTPQGWVYISVGGGRILALRPHANN